ncbi:MULTISPECIES: hypothetical protein [Mucilaginibacter]|uniref:Lipoprotein n=1 Tax=Mucilaginibacter rubeus TaxID=2027860 RepID=A0A5C1I8D7_9SPHI|nr:MULTISPECIES: hypothetical protein [Mucilaginibacter]QEM13956.1 hypothetical protein DEO27_029370 [Mucilaginibacter rubeus]
MKRKFVALALLISAVVSVTSGCVVREDYGHHHRYRNGYNNGYNNGYQNGSDHGHYHDRGY